ncbi:hypothetical protein A4R63_07335 [Corynebacterium pseudotuberculosis]|nr:hypothetical protein ATN03_07355 [Corynebacterium pseudotuberculosis]ANZ92303.1 hypothetical protein CPMB20_07820 [Corynebacterium pseudotuberculosis]APB11307.1 hypothetical protein A4R72_07565 [Corynebacterium pseudotuberculosis]APB13351.1 hypothetical protein A4R71_07580 [Corynebacterium pseudotuberculosis]APB15395.1 hypothetical protein A4R68_07575 [Corynebacterium pseudotuberculosis]
MVGHHTVHPTGKRSVQVSGRQDAQSIFLEKFFESPQRRGELLKKVSDIVYWELRYQAQKAQLDNDSEEDGDQA